MHGVVADGRDGSARGSGRTHVAHDDDAGAACASVTLYLPTAAKILNRGATAAAARIGGACD